MLHPNDFARLNVPDEVAVETFKALGLEVKALLEAATAEL
jgi:hypothetical protein